MNEIDFDWDDLRLFLAVARGGGLAGARDVTGKSAPTLGRRMLALERRLGADLFRRLPRGYELTEAGDALLEKVSGLETGIQPILDLSASAVPVVKLSSGLWVSQVLCENVQRLVARDAIVLRFVASDAVVDIGRREALIGIRNHRPEGVGLAGRRIGRVRFAVYATDPGVTTWARVIGMTPSARWGQVASRTGGAIEVTSPRNALDLALVGQAKAVLPMFIGAPYDTLTQVSDPIEELDHDQWLVTHHEDRFVPEVRRVINRTHAVLRDICIVP